MRWCAAILLLLCGCAPSLTSQISAIYVNYDGYAVAMIDTGEQVNGANLTLYGLDLKLNDSKCVLDKEKAVCYLGQFRTYKIAYRGTIKRLILDYVNSAGVRGHWEQ